MAELTNSTLGNAELIPLIDRHGSNVLVVIVKRTFDIADDGGMCPAPAQTPIAFEDVCDADGELVEASDITDFKPSTDLVVTPPARTEVDAAMPRVLSVDVGGVCFGGPVETPWPFGPVPRHRLPRKAYVGTYDQAWKDARFPLLPLDFDARHNQVAPAAQITPERLAGDETVTLSGLYSPARPCRTVLPGKAVVVSGNIRGRYFTEIAALDTVTISSDRPSLSLVWRLALRPRQKAEEVRQVFVSMASIRSTRQLYGRP